MRVKYSVWVGGTEVNDVYLTKDEADTLAMEYIEDGYDDVFVEEVVAMTKYNIIRNDYWVDDAEPYDNAVEALEEWIDIHGLALYGEVDGGEEYAFAYVLTELGQPNLYEAIYDDREED